MLVLRQAVGVEGERDVRRLVADEGQVELHRGARTPRSAGACLEVRRDRRIVEVSLGEEEPPASPHDFLSPFELIVGQVDARSDQPRERALQTVFRDQSRQITELAAGSIQQRAVRAARESIDQTIGEIQEALLTGGQAASHRGRRLFPPLVPTQEAREGPRQPGQPRDVARSLTQGGSDGHSRSRRRAASVE